MNSISNGKRFLNLTLCLITVFTLASCASNNYREVAEEHKDDVSKIQDREQTPRTFHGNRFEKYNQEY